jgi:7-cyano-7-deazaguanine synthase
MKPRKKAVVLLSGGLDSAVTLWWAKKNGWRCHALSFDYGQRHHREMKSARALARRAKVPHQIVQFALPWGGSSLTTTKKALPHHALATIGHGKIPSTYVPARNTLFLSFGLSWADQMDAEAIVIGANALDYSGYPDCRPRYLRAYEQMARLATRLGTEKKKPLKILAPLVRLNKAQIIRLGRRLGVPIDQTWSCYSGGRKPCGRCDSCQLRDKGFREAGEKA